MSVCCLKNACVTATTLSLAVSSVIHANGNQESELWLPERDRTQVGVSSDVISLNDIATDKHALGVRSGRQDMILAGGLSAGIVGGILALTWNESGDDTGDEDQVDTDPDNDDDDTEFVGGEDEPVAAPEDFHNDAWDNQPALATIKADEAYKWGVDGSGSTIAVFDAMVAGDHESLSDSYDESSSRNFADDAEGSTADHGTQVASIIAGDPESDVHGAAPGVDFASLGVVDGEVYDYSAIRQAAEYATSLEMDVFNASFNVPVSSTGGDVTEMDDDEPAIDNTAFVWEPVLESDAVVVYSAGNDPDWDGTSSFESDTGLPVDAGLPNKRDEYEDHWLAVVALDEDGELASYSHRCEGGEDWCLAAPGGQEDGLLAAIGGDDEAASVTGTSFAAPLVSGSLALLQERFPGITAKEARERLLETADDEGEYSDASAYGQGLIDLEAATDPVGEMSLATGSTMNETTALGPSTVQTNAAWASAVHNAMSQQDIMALDELNAPFKIRGDALAHTRDNETDDLGAYVDSLSPRSQGKSSQGRGGHEGWSFDVSPNLASQPTSVASGDHPAGGVTGLTDGALGIGARLNERHGGAHVGVFRNEHALQNGRSSAVTLRPAEIETRSIHGAFLHSDLTGSHAQASIQMVVARVDDGVSAMERGGALRMRGDGEHIGLHTQSRLEATDRWGVQIHGEIMHARDTREGAVSVDNAIIAGAGLGVDRNHDGHRSFIDVNIPPHPVSGTVAFDVPVARDEDGAITYAHNEASLRTQKPPVDVAVGHQVAVNDTLHLGVRARTQYRDHGHESVRSDDIHVGAHWLY